MRATVGLFVVGFALLSGTACQIGDGDGDAERQDGATEFGGSTANFSVTTTLMTSPNVIAGSSAVTTWKGQVQNVGTGTGTTTLTIVPPPELENVSWTCDGCATGSGFGTLTSTFQLDPGLETVQFEFDATVRSSATGTFAVEAQISPDSNSLDNHALFTLTVGRDVDVHLTFSDGVDTADAGDTLVYTLAVDNSGDSDVGPLTVADNVIDGPFDSVSWTCTGEGAVACPNGSGTGSVAQTIPSLPTGTALIYTITAVLDPTFEGVVLTQAEVDGDDFEAPLFATDETTVVGDESCLPETLDVVATRYYAPTVWVDGEATLCETASIEIPAELPVTWGNASKHAAWLEIGSVHCDYRGNATVPHPTTPEQGGDAYVFRSCDDGSQPGDSVEGDTVRMHVHNGDQKAPYGTPPHDNSTEVTVTLTIGG